MVAAVLLLCDQINWFYAVEARPYAGVALCVTLAVLLQKEQLCDRKFLQRVASVLFFALAVYLHYTAWIVVVALTIAGYWMALVQRDWLQLKRLIQDSMIVTLLVAPALYDLMQISRNQSLWQSFASNTSVVHLRTLLPIDAWFCISGAVWMLNAWKVNKRVKLDAVSILAIELGLAVIVSVLAVWLLALLKIAPLIHTRYVIGGYPLLLVASIGLLSTIRPRKLILAGASVMALAWMISQGGPFLLRYGRAVVWQRQEDWPGAIRIIEEQLSQNSRTKIAFAPMLIETKDLPTIEQFGAQNLKYAFTSALALYQQSNLQDSVVDCRLLSNQIEQWHAELATNETSSDGSDRFIILSRAHAYRVLPWLEEIASESGMKAELLFGNPSQRLSVVQIQKMSERQP